MTQLLINTVRTQTQTGNIIGGSPKKQGWQAMANAFIGKLNQSQVKQKWQLLKRQYKTVHAIKSNSELGWDEETKRQLVMIAHWKNTLR
ncbi:hypothetical protein DFS34DRAFT_654614 [Phlyctochytrium arcticum]|nr:hypothetical protein DFS34DRAFT_654614 [Phlyctochytrium arcticum]